MRPEAASSEKLKVESKKSEYLELGVPEEWVDPLKALGYITIDKLKEVEKTGKLVNDLNGYKKKNKLDLPGLSPETVGEWINNASKPKLCKGKTRKSNPCKNRPMKGLEYCFSHRQ